MRKIILCTILIISQLLSAQEQTNKMNITPLNISDVKWVYIKFKSAITYADLGTRDIQLEKTSLPNILKIKSQIAAFDETSVTVIIQSGEVYTFLLNYSQDPEFTAIDMNIPPTNTIGQKQKIKTYNAELSHIKTTHIVFPEKIIDISVGNPNLIAAEKISDVNNIIRCKSINSSFDIYKELNIIALSENGTIYPFNVTYNENPQEMSISLSNDSNSIATFSQTQVNAANVPTISNKILDIGQKLNIGIVKQKIYFLLNSISVIDDVIMFNLSIQNKSNIDYEIDFVRCYIINNKTTKKQAFQMDIKEPIYSYSTNSTIISPKNKYDCIQFHQRFTIPDKHSLYFEVFEKNGGRHLKFLVPNKELLSPIIIK